MRAEIESKLMQAAQTYETTVMSDKAFKQAMKDPKFSNLVQDVVPFFKELVKMSVNALMDLYYDHKKGSTDHADRLQYECNTIAV